MNYIQSSVRSLTQTFDGKIQELINDIDTVHMVWLEEIQQEANQMFSREFNAEPELMTIAPSQKKNSRRKRVSMGHQKENQARLGFSKGKRGNLRGSSVKSLNFIPEEETIPIASTSGATTTTTTKELKRPTRKNKQTAAEPATRPSSGLKTEDVQKKKPELVEKKVDQTNEVNSAEDESDRSGTSPLTLPAVPSPDVVEERQRLAAEERDAAVKKAAAAAAAQAASYLNTTVDIERSVMSTPVGKGGGLNVTVDIEKSPQSYVITPKGGNKPLPKSADDYGMDQNSDDSTDDESAPRKPIPSWAEGHHLQQIIMKQSELQNSHNPPDLDSFFE